MSCTHPNLHPRLSLDKYEQLIPHLQQNEEALKCFLDAFYQTEISLLRLIDTFVFNLEQEEPNAACALLMEFVEEYIERIWPDNNDRTRLLAVVEKAKEIRNAQTSQPTA